MSKTETVYSGDPPTMRELATANAAQRREIERQADEIAWLRRALTFIAQGGNTFPKDTDYVSFIEQHAKVALGLLPTGFCSAHQTPDVNCRTCYPFREGSGA